MVEGLVLSNTCSLSGNMSKAGYQDLMKIIESQRKFKKWLAFLPFPLIKRMMRWGGDEKRKPMALQPQEKAAMEGTVRRYDGTAHQRSARLSFTPACREDLIALMPSPTVVTDLTGGHLALMVRLEQYADLVTKFILERTP